LLEENGIDFAYREYRTEPLTVEELKNLFGLLGVSPRELLRRRDKAFRELGLSGEEDDDALIALMHENPTLLERPIGVRGDSAVVGRPPERLLELVR
jgi:arsenate reductase